MGRFAQHPIYLNTEKVFLLMCSLTKCLSIAVAHLGLKVVQYSGWLGECSQREYQKFPAGFTHQLFDNIKLLNFDESSQNLHIQYCRLFQNAK